MNVKGNKRKAEAFLNGKIHEYKSSNTIYSDDILFIDYIFLWLESIKNSVEPNTYESYKDMISRYVKPYFGERKITLHKLEPIIIQQMYNHYMDKGLSSTTVLKVHANVRKSLQYAVNTNMIPYNPADRVEKPKKKKYIGKYYDELQTEALLRAAKDEPMYTVILLAAFYGLRRSEALGLKWNNVDFDNNYVTICDTVVEYRKIYEKDHTKTNSSLRTLPLVPVIKEHLEELKLTQEENRAFFGETYVENDYVCKRNDGNMFRPDYISERFGKLLAQHNLPKIRFHDLRHSAATMLLSYGFSLKEIQEWLGHADISTTANIYAHLQYKAKQEMAEKLSSKINFKAE